VTAAAPRAAESAGGTAVSLRRLIGLRAQAAALSLRPKGRVLALRAGAHLSPFRGRGMEFDETRVYQPGDDVRNMDWRVTARSTRPHVKLFREERERPVWLLVDQGASMRFGTRVEFKSVVAAEAAALIAWAAVDRGDRVGALVFHEGGHRELRPAPRTHGVLPVLRALAGDREVRPNGATPTLDRTLQRLVRIARPGSLVILLSDFAGLGSAAEPLLARIAAHCETVLVHIYDALEADPPPPGRYPVSDGRHVLVLDTAPAGWREAYRQQFRARQEHLRELCRRYALHFLSLRTDEPIRDTLAAGLALRQRSGAS